MPSFKPFDNKACEKLFLQGAKALGLPLSATQCELSLAYLEMLHRWNQRMNLTAIRDPIEMVRRHLLDSLAVYPYVQGDRVIDVGTGAGLPGIPLSILLPDKQFFLLDSNHKKQVFVSQVAKSLSLKNVHCIHREVKAYQPTEKFSTILTRAFAPLPEMISLTEHLLAQDGCFAAMLGKVEESPVALLEGFEMKHMVSLKVPGEMAQRHIGIIKRK